MPTLSKGSFSLNLGFVKLGGELSEDDRQCAWELYVELSTRVAAVGKSRDTDCTNFDGELYIESLQSLYAFFQEARRIMRRFPVGKLGGDKHEHLGLMISRIMSDVLRPFLEKWQVQYRHWWENESNPRLAPLERQKEFLLLAEFLEDWASVRWLMRELQRRLVKVYDLMDVVVESSETEGT
jgi:hypothetical protein